MATPMARLPLASSSRAVASAAFWSRSAIAILAPSRAKTRAISLPMPLAAPVITATLSARRPWPAMPAAAPDNVLSCKFMGFSFPGGSLGLHQVVVDDLAEPEGQVGDDVHAGHDLEHRQLGERRQGMRDQRELRRPGPRTLEIDIREVVLDELADARRPVDMRNDLEQEIGCQQ